MRKYFFVILFSLGVLSLSVEAFANTFSSFWEAGKKTAFFDDEPQEQDLVYKYQKYFLKQETSLSKRLDWAFSTQIYDKDYQNSDNLDNHSVIFKSSLDYDCFKNAQEEFLVGLDLRYQVKNFSDSMVNEYSQLKFLPSLKYLKKDDFQLKVSLGTNDYAYHHAENKDQRSVLSSLAAKKFLLDKKLQVLADWQIENGRRKISNRKKIKQDITAGFDYLFEFSWVEKFSSRVSWGSRDTKSEEERDDDFDYTYQNSYFKTSHQVRDKLKTSLKYQKFNRDYLGTNLDNKGFIVSNRWDWDFFQVQDKLAGLLFGLEHKKISFGYLPGNDYKRDFVDLNLTFQEKKKWQVSGGVKYDRYHYRDSRLDQNNNYFLAGLEKWFKQGDVSLSLDYRYRLNEDSLKNTANYQVLRLGFKVSGW